MSRMSPGVLAPSHELLTPDEWSRRGRDQRRLAPRSSHAQWEPPAAALRKQANAEAIMRPCLIGTRSGTRVLACSWRMLTGSGRSAANGPGPGPHSDERHSGAGVRRRAPAELRHVRGAGPAAGLRVNDFDETLPAPFEWDVKRPRGELRGRAGQGVLRARGAPPPGQPYAVTAPRWRTTRRCASSRSGTPGSMSTRSPGCSRRFSQGVRCDGVGVISRKPTAGPA